MCAARSRRPCRPIRACSSRLIDGTLLLDEIGELPLPLQVKLLRVMEDRLVWPVGGTRPAAVDVRIIASTNRDLPGEVLGGRFRQDLFYRLDVVQLKVPPLRERRGDIPLLVDHLVGRLNAKLGTGFLGVEREALRALAARPWKGNVRELENALERAMVLGGGELLSLADLSVSEDPATAPVAHPRDLREAVRQFEHRYLIDVLDEARRDKRKAADLLGISLASLYRKLSPAPDGSPPPGGASRSTSSVRLQRRRSVVFSVRRGPASGSPCSRASRRGPPPAPR